MLAGKCRRNQYLTCLVSLMVLSHCSMPLKVKLASSSVWPFVISLTDYTVYGISRPGYWNGCNFFPSPGDLSQTRGLKGDLLHCRSDSCRFRTRKPYCLYNLQNQIWNAICINISKSIIPYLIVEIVEMEYKKTVLIYRNWDVSWVIIAKWFKKMRVLNSYKDRLKNFQNILLRFE